MTQVKAVNSVYTLLFFKKNKDFFGLHPLHPIETAED